MGIENHFLEMFRKKLHFFHNCWCKTNADKNEKCFISVKVIDIHTTCICLVKNTDTFDIVQMQLIMLFMYVCVASPSLLKPRYDTTILEIIDVKCYEFYSFTYTSNKYCKINLNYFPLIGSAPFAWLHFIQ